MYLQVHELLAQRVADGEWRPGAYLPNEQELARELGVSPGTVRKALDKLEADRIVVRRQGKGTSVVDHTAQGLALRFSNILNANGEKIIGATKIIVLAQEVGLPTGTERTHLAIEEGEEVLRTRRVHEYRGRRCIYEEACLAVDRLPGLQRDEVAGDYLVAPLAQHHGIHLARAVEKIAVAETSSEVATWLAVPPRTMLLKLERRVFSMDDQPVEWQMALCNLQDEVYVVEMK